MKKLPSRTAFLLAIVLFVVATFGLVGAVFTFEQWLSGRLVVEWGLEQIPAFVSGHLVSFGLYLAVCLLAGNNFFNILLKTDRLGRELAQLSREKSELISVVTHEFRTPLTGISGFAEMIRDEPLEPSEIKEYAGDIVAGSRRLARMINDMLDLDRIESGRATLHLEPVSIREVIDEAATEVKPIAAARELLIDLRDLPSIRADRDKIAQVIINLLSNAIKYSPDGTPIRVAAQVEGSAIHIAVEDHGFGIPEADLERIFERYARIDSEKTQGIRGTGLGLPIARQIAILHGGKLWAESAIGKGSTLHLLIPIAPPAAVA